MRPESCVTSPASSLITIHDAATVRWEHRQEEAEDPSAQQPGGCRRPRRCLLGDAVRPDLLRAPARRRHRCRLRAPSRAPWGTSASTTAFINRVRDEVTPGTSALFVMSLRRGHGQGARRLRGVTPELDLHQPQRRAGERHPRGLRRAGLTRAGGPASAGSGVAGLHAARTLGGAGPRVPVLHPVAPAPARGLPGRRRRHRRRPGLRAGGAGRLRVAGVRRPWPASHRSAPVGCGRWSPSWPSSAAVPGGSALARAGEPHSWTPSRRAPGRRCSSRWSGSLVFLLLVALGRGGRPPVPTRCPRGSPGGWGERAARATGLLALVVRDGPARQRRAVGRIHAVRRPRVRDPSTARRRTASPSRRTWTALGRSGFAGVRGTPSVGRARSFTGQRTDQCRDLRLPRRGAGARPGPDLRRACPPPTTPSSAPTSLSVTCTRAGRLRP